MVVVAITGVLATIGVYSMRQHLLRSKTTEAMATIQSIRGAQESWASSESNLSYLDVSATLTSWFPDAPGTSPRGFWTNTSHADFVNWRLLNPAAPANVLYGYAVKAGPPGVSMAEPAIEGAVPEGAATQRWYVIQAKADSDGDGEAAYFVAASGGDGVQVFNAGE
jgi:Tfp pilus assembly protein PilE